jgi:hypothetical protein
MRALLSSATFWLGLFGLGFLLFLWSSTMKSGLYARFPWGGDTGLVVIAQGEVAAARLEGRKPMLMSMPALGRDRRAPIFLNHRSRFFLSLPVSLFVLAYITVWACLCGRRIARYQEGARVLGLE